MKILVYMIVVIIGVAILLMSWFFQKDKMNSLVMPGPVIQGHAEHEKNCSLCHASFDKTNQSNLCIDCHTKVGEDITAGQGFHGRSQTVALKQCQACHTDHIGREADIVALDKSVFNHDLTDFPLQGAHASSIVACEACHTENKKFREATQDCYGCHQQDDNHDGQLGTNCDSCHKSTSWLDTYFDHNETEFPLLGEHKNVACDSCHANNQYEKTPRECVSCHLINDIHDSPIDARCESCHSPQGWDDVEFDHNRLTEYELRDKHAQVACDACHTDLLFEVKTANACVDCHRPEDVHKGTNGNRCDNCHKTSGWTEVTFDHDKDTKFLLRGRHQQAACQACHRDDIGEEKPSMSCQSCHVTDDVHRGQLNDCAACHNEEGWSQDIRFDHDLTTFPLIGMHAAIGCEECHVSHAFKSIESKCVDCHSKDDTHKGTLGTRCGNCHNPNDWRLWEFNHNEQTEFPLEGAHLERLCEDCHKDPMREGEVVAKDCHSCHARDNVHGGKFREIGTRCDVCHDVTAFDHIKEDRIRGFHENPIEFDVRLAENCYSCHINEDVHGGQFGRRCDRCHVVRSWKELSIGN